MRNRIAAAFATTFLLLGSLGGAGLATASRASTAHAAKKHAKKHAKVKTKGCIPQTNVHTDHDPDNHGGPNDGDGCV